MAVVALTITAEFDLLYDAVDTVERAHRALATRHGAAFRDLERKIEALMEAPDWGEVPMADLEPGRVVFFVPEKLAELITDARALGVIR